MKSSNTTLIPQPRANRRLSKKTFLIFAALCIISAVSVIVFKLLPSQRASDSNTPEGSYHALGIAARNKDKAVIIRLTTPRGLGEILNDVSYTNGVKRPQDLNKHDLERFHNAMGGANAGKTSGTGMKVLRVSDGVADVEMKTKSGVAYTCYFKLETGVWKYDHCDAPW